MASLGDGFDEFGIEVDRPTAAALHVFRGAVEMRLADSSTGAVRAVRLAEHRSARIEELESKQQVADLVSDPALANGFARRMCNLVVPKTADKTFVWLKSIDAEPGGPLIAVGEGGREELPAGAAPKADARSAART